MKIPIRPFAWSLPEILETRIAPAVFFVSGADLSISTAGGNAATLDPGAAALAAATAALPLQAGDSVVFDLNGNARLDAGQDSKFLTVKSGMATAFFSDLNGNGMFERDEFTGLAVGDRFSGKIAGDLNGSIATNLADAGGFTGGYLQMSSITGLKVKGRILGGIVAGNWIDKVTIKQQQGADSTIPSVEHIRTGTAAAGFGVSYNGGADTLSFDFAQPAGIHGGSISNVKLANGAKTIITGKGGDSAGDDGGWGGDIVDLTVGGIVVAAAIQTGAGGSGFEFGGDGGSIFGLKVATQRDLIVSTGNGGPASATDGLGGYGGGISNFNIRGNLIDSELISFEPGRGGATVDGVGGNGGSIERGKVKVAGAGSGLFLTAGGGAEGLLGGDGGGVFRVALTITENAGAIFVNGGDGGHGTGIGGVGGDGGDLDGLRVLVMGSIHSVASFGAGSGASATDAIGYGGDGGGIFNLGVRLLGSAESLAIKSGNGADGGPNFGHAGNGGDIVGMSLFVGSVAGRADIFAGNGGTASSGFGGDGGSIIRAAFTAGGDVGVLYQEHLYILAGEGGSTRIGDSGFGGELEHVTVRTQGLHGLNAVAGGAGNTDEGDAGDGGDVFRFRWQNLGSVAGGGVQVVAGDGGSSNENGAGAGGRVLSSLLIDAFGFEDDVQIRAGDGGNGRETIVIPDGEFFADGGSIVGLRLLLPRADVELFGGDGGDIANEGDADGRWGEGGLGGEILGINGIVGTLSAVAGRGGSSDAGFGGDGGDVAHIKLKANGFVRLLSAGDAGSGTDGDGFAGDITRVKVKGDIGDFSAAFDMSNTSGMGGLSAGMAASGIPEDSGIISNVKATRIAAIAAGRPSGNALSVSNAVWSIAAIKANVIGADLDGDGAFDFINTTGTAAFEIGASPGDPADVAIDGLVLVVAGGFPRPPVTPLLVVEV